jgi:tRNA(Ile2)-agmatinylcytidine synthase
MLIGIDDTDSENGLCTTYLAAVLMERLSPFGEIRGMPKLIRLNPCARYKTRGNAALAFELESDRIKEVREIALKAVLEFSDFSGANTNPGLVIADSITQPMKSFYRRAVTEILEIDEARSILDEEGIWYCGFKKGRGLIGALAAVGASLPDFTYELIVYRERRLWGTPRYIDSNSVWKADSLTYPGTWDTVDHHNNRIVFAPHSKDPVLFGIRGADPNAIEEAFQTIKSEPFERKVLYMTNQGTDAHIMQGEMERLIDCQSYRLQGKVAESAVAIEGGHLFFTLENGKVRLKCAAYEPTKNFRSIVKLLMPGDELEVFGSLREGTLNLEKLNLLDLARREVMVVPSCPLCKRRMESAGHGQGYRCRRCKTKAPNRERQILHRFLETGFYEVPPSARRHLSKPLLRMGGEKVHPSR